MELAEYWQSRFVFSRRGLDVLRQEITDVLNKQKRKRMTTKELMETLLHFNEDAEVRIEDSTGDWPIITVHTSYAEGPVEKVIFISNRDVEVK